MTVGPIKRRTFIATLGSAAAWPVATRAQQPTQIPQVGWIWPGAEAGNPTEVAGFKEGLRELGYVEGKNIIVEYRFGENSVRRLPEFAAEFARLNVSVIVAMGDLAFRAVRRAAPDTPIVFLTADPIGAGVVTNLSRPGGNVTGVSVMRLAGKWPELAKEALPGLSPLPRQSDKCDQRHHLERRAAFCRGARYELPVIAG
jgi:putative tryptophan/tyrosine transport system substrate-binding protein